MDNYEPRRKKESNARRRQAARLRKRGEKNTTSMDDLSFERDQYVSRISKQAMSTSESLLHRFSLLAADMGWYIRRNPMITASVMFVLVIVFILYFLSFLFSGRIPPKVSAMGVSLAGLQVEDAEVLLQSTWHNMAIDLVLEGEIINTIHPSTLGISFDALETAKTARNVRLGAFPFGETVDPIVEVNTLTAQNFLLDLANQYNKAPFNAGFDFLNEELVTVKGRYGRTLDVPLTVEKISQDISKLLTDRRFEVLIISLEPDMMDSTLYVETMQYFLAEQPQLIGYDPFKNQTVTWTVSPEQFTKWVAAGPVSLTLREDAFTEYYDALNMSLNPDGLNTRYLSPVETTNAIRDALSTLNPQINLRIRYRDTMYTVVKGDTSFRISRKTGIPQLLIEEANSSSVMEILSIGEEIIIPSRDFTMPNPPLAHKRIVVDLETLYLMAYENGQLVFEWTISAGVDYAYTSPGVYQILSHKNPAYGSSVILCNNAGLQCGEWEMSWFMGIYEVIPGLANGFHGKVLLPNGNYLGNASIGERNTFGCVMSGEEEAELLYNWAEEGTVVEIISDEFPPTSDLGQLTYAKTHAPDA